MQNNYSSHIDSIQEDANRKIKPIASLTIQEKTSRKLLDNFMMAYRNIGKAGGKTSPNSLTRKRLESDPFIKKANAKAKELVAHWVASGSYPKGMKYDPKEKGANYIKDVLNQLSTNNVTTLTKHNADLTEYKKDSEAKIIALKKMLDEQDSVIDEFALQASYSLKDRLLPKLLQSKQTKMKNQIIELKQEHRLEPVNKALSADAMYYVQDLMKVMINFGLPKKFLSKTKKTESLTPADIANIKSSIDKDLDTESKNPLKRIQAKWIQREVKMGLHIYAKKKSEEWASAAA